MVCRNQYTVKINVSEIKTLFKYTQVQPQDNPTSTMVRVRAYPKSVYVGIITVTSMTIRDQNRGYKRINSLLRGSGSGLGLVSPPPPATPSHNPEYGELRPSTIPKTLTFILPIGLGVRVRV